MKWKRHQRLLTLNGSDVVRMVGVHVQENSLRRPHQYRHRHDEQRVFHDVELHAQLCRAHSEILEAACIRNELGEEVCVAVAIREILDCEQRQQTQEDEDSPGAPRDELELKH